MAQIHYNCLVPGWTADQWNGQVNIGFELSYNKNTNETTVIFTANECYHKYFGINGWGTEATTNITIYATDNTGDKKTGWFYTYGYTDGGTKQFNATPSNIVVKHSNAIGAKSIIIETSTTIKVYLKKGVQSTGTGTYSEAVALPASPVSVPTSFMTSAQSIIIPTGSIPLSWSGATAGINNAIKGYHLFWKVGSAPTASSYTDKIDVSSASYTIKLNLGDNQRGQTVYTAIQTYGEMGVNYDSDLLAGPSVKINSRPAAPALSATNATLPSTVGAYKVKVVAGKDNDLSQTIQVRQGDDGEAQASGTQFSFNGAGTFTFYSFDGLENSATGTSITIIRNSKPEVGSINTTFSASINTNDKTFSTAQLKNADSKKLTAAQWYIRSAATSAEISSAAARQITTGTITNSSSDDSSSCTLIINPLASTPIVNPGYYYQIGVQLKDEYEYSDIAWSSNIKQIYGQLSLTLNSITATHFETGMSTAYASYYRIPKINLSWKSPTTFPAGLSSLWYSIFYSIDAGNSWKQWNSGIQSLATNTTYTPTIDFSSVGRGDFLAKIVLYDKKDGSNQQLETSMSNKLYYSPDPQWMAGSTPTLAYTIEADDNRTCVRPNYSSKGTNALTLSIPYPSTINTLLQTNKADLQYAIYLYQDGKDVSAEVQSKQKITIGDSAATETGPLKLNVAYSKLTNLYSTFFDSDKTKWIGPYNMSIMVRFFDAFEESIDTPKMSFVLDFREKPKKIETLKIGRDGVLSNNYAAVAAKRSANTVIFPTSSIDAEKSILVGEHLIIAFQKPALSYEAQTIGQYIFTLYNSEHSAIYTYRTADIISASIYGESSLNCVVIPAADFLSTATTFYATIRQQDSQSYNDNISIESDGSNSLCGGSLEQPIINFEMPELSVSGGSMNITVTKKTASLSWSGIQAKYNSYLRTMVYDDISYSPLCNLFLQISENNDFSSSFELPLASYSSTNKTYKLEANEFSKTLSGLTGNCFVRIGVIYNTGLKLDSSGSIVANQITLYSTPKIFFSEAPTVSYRQNQIGVNGIPDANTAFKVSITQNNYLVTLEGYNVADPTIIHSITFDLCNGKIISTNFMATQDEIDQICNGTYI